MKVTYCLDVFVRFAKPGLQGASISRNAGPTTTRYLRVECDAAHLCIKFCDKDDDVVKEINYNFQHVAEYSCEGWVEDKSK